MSAIPSPALIDLVQVSLHALRFKPDKRRVGHSIIAAIRICAVLPAAPRALLPAALRALFPLWVQLFALQSAAAARPGRGRVS